MRYNYIIKNGYRIIIVLLAAHVLRHKAGLYAYIGDICSANVLRKGNINSSR